MGNLGSKKSKKNKDGAFSKKSTVRKSSRRKGTKKEDTIIKPEPLKFETNQNAPTQNINILKTFKVPNIQEENEPQLQNIDANNSTQKIQTIKPEKDTLSNEQPSAKNPSKNNLLIINDSISEIPTKVSSEDEIEDNRGNNSYEETSGMEVPLTRPQDLQFQENPLYEKNNNKDHVHKFEKSGEFIESYETTIIDSDGQPVTESYIRKKTISENNNGTTIRETFGNKSNLSEVLPSKIEFPNSPPKLGDFNRHEVYSETRSLFNYNETDVEIRGKKPVIRRLSSRESTDMKRKVFYSQMLNGSSQFDVSDSISIVGIDSLDAKTARESVQELLSKIDTFSKTKTYDDLKHSKEILDYDIDSYPDKFQEFAINLQEIESNIKNMSISDIHLYFPTLKDSLHNIWQKVYNVKVESGEDKKKQELIDRIKIDLDKLNKRYLMRK